MINFMRVTPAQKEIYEKILFSCPGRSCEFGFVNKVLWGRQEAAYFDDCMAFFSHFHGKSVYPYPVGNGDRKTVLAAMIQDAAERGIPCRIVSMNETDAKELEDWFPGMFHIRMDRDSADYVYAIDDLADLKGRKYQKKRNHVNHFHIEYPDSAVVPLTKENLHSARQMVDAWYEKRMAEDPTGEYTLEKLAMGRAFDNFSQLQLEGLMLVNGEDVLAVTMGSRLSADTIDVHFEKAREDADGAYTVINCEFAKYLREKLPQIRFLNREDDLGLEGLRKAKLSYHPHHLNEKYWAYLKGDLHEEI